MGFCSNASDPVHIQYWEINRTHKILIARRIVIENNPESSILQFFFSNFSAFALLQKCHIRGSS